MRPDSERWEVKNDSPFFKKLLLPFKFLGIVLADKGYLSRENHQFVVDKNGCAFIPFKKDSIVKSLGSPAWKFTKRLLDAVPMIFKGIYHQRSRVECIAALKKRYGDQVYSKKARVRRREMAIRFISLQYSTYNLLRIFCQT